jgi:hypothetical protein
VAAWAEKLDDVDKMERAAQAAADHLARLEDQAGKIEAKLRSVGSTQSTVSVSAPMSITQTLAMDSCS